MPQHIDRHLAAKVVLAEFHEHVASGVGHFQAVKQLVCSEQPAVVRRDVALGKPFIDRPKKRLVVLVFGHHGPTAAVVYAAQGVGRKQTALLGKRDKQDAIKKFLRRRDEGTGVNVVGLGQRRDELDAPAFVVGVQLSGDLLFYLAGFAQQLGGAPSQQVFGTQQQHQTLVDKGVIGDFEQVKSLVHTARVAKGVKPNFEHVGQQQKFALRQIHRVLPHLLDRRLVAPRHHHIEVACIRAFEFDGDQTGISLRSEMPQHQISASLADIVFIGQREFSTASKGLVAKQFNKKLLCERCP